MEREDPSQGTKRPHEEDYGELHPSTRRRTQGSFDQSTQNTGELLVKSLTDAVLLERINQEGIRNLLGNLIGMRNNHIDIQAIEDPQNLMLLQRLFEASSHHEGHVKLQELIKSAHMLHGTAEELNRLSEDYNLWEDTLNGMPHWNVESTSSDWYRIQVMMDNLSKRINRHRNYFDSVLNQSIYFLEIRLNTIQQNLQQTVHFDFQ